MKVTVLQNIMNANDQIAAANYEVFKKNKVLAVNIMSSPGAGKTTLLMETIHRLKDKVRIAVIEADIASTVDADRISKEGVIALQINTGGQCHTDSNMLANALSQLPLNEIDLLFVENVGNLICTADFRIGTQKAVCLLSVPEGDDKPIKYPLIFTTVDAVVITKMDYLPLSDFRVDFFQNTVKGMNEKARLMKVSAKTGEGVDEWIDWLQEQLKEIKK